MLRGQLTELLAHARITLTPVLDLAEQVSVNAYEIPEHIRQRVQLTTPGEYFPYATNLSRNLDYDHVTPYDEHGPPGQTGTHNTGALTRGAHRAKTHAGYRAVQTAPGQYVWRTPHGLYLMVDHTGTHRLPDRIGDRIHGITPTEDPAA
jgi:hypothetical protein